MPFLSMFLMLEDFSPDCLCFTFLVNALDCLVLFHCFQNYFSSAGYILGSILNTDDIGYIGQSEKVYFVLYHLSKDQNDKNNLPTW